MRIPVILFAILLFAGFIFAWLFLISIPRLHGGVVTLFGKPTGEIKGPGLHFLPFWKKVEGRILVEGEEKLVNLGVKTLDMGGESFPTKDGQEVIIKASLQYHVTLEGLPKFVNLTDETVGLGLKNRFWVYIGVAVANLKGEECVGSKRGVISKEVLDAFRNVEGEDLKYEKYGIEIDSLDIADADLDPESLAARKKIAAAKYKMTAKNIELKSLSERITKLRKKTDEKLSQKEGLEAIQLQDGKITKNVQEITGLKEILELLIKEAAKIIRERKNGS